MPLPPPEKASRSADPLEPIETWTVSMPSMSSRTSSTCCGRGVLGLEARRGADVLRHREGVLPRVAEEVRLHERRERRSVPTSTSTARPSVTQECLQRPAQDRQVGLLQAARRGVRAPRGRSRVPSASRSGLPGRRNQYASTGTIVSATNSEAVIAIVIVSANGRKSSPVTSPTNAIGRNTATVVIGRGRDRGGDLADGAQDRRHLVGVADVVALDVLDHDDRVVDHAPDRDRERAEGEDVQRVAERLDADEGDQHAGRDRDRRDEGRAHRQQEDRITITAKNRPSSPSCASASIDCWM